MKHLISLAFFFLLAGCQGISDLVQVPPEQQSKVAQFQLPKVAGPGESVVYVVNKAGIEEKWAQGLIFTTELRIGDFRPVETIPGQYAVLTIKPGTYELWAARICNKTSKSQQPTPPAGTVMRVREPGWDTHTHFYGRKFSKKDSEFEFVAGKTYVFSMNVNCALVVQAGGIMFYPRIRLADEVGGKYLVMTNTPVRN